MPKIRTHRIELLIASASLPGADPADHAEALSYLAHHTTVERAWNVSSHPTLYVPMAIVTKDKLNVKKAREALFPLIADYLQVGARFGDGAGDTTYVFVVMPIEEINSS